MLRVILCPCCCPFLVCSTHLYLCCADHTVHTKQRRRISPYYAIGIQIRQIVTVALTVNHSSFCSRSTSCDAICRLVSFSQYELLWSFLSLLIWSALKHCCAKCRSPRDLACICDIECQHIFRPDRYHNSQGRPSSRIRCFPRGHVYIEEKSEHLCRTGIPWWSVESSLLRMLFLQDYFCESREPWPQLCKHSKFDHSKHSKPRDNWCISSCAISKLDLYSDVGGTNCWQHRRR